MKLDSNGGKVEEVIPFMGSFDSTMKVDAENPLNLIISNSMHKLFSLNTKTKNVFEIDKKHGERIFDYLSLPKNKILMLTEDGYLILKKINNEGESSELIDYKKIKFEKLEGKSTEKMVYCPEEDIVAVCINVYTHLSRILLFRVTKNKLVLKSTLDFRDLKMNYFETLAFHKPQGRFIALSAFSNYKKSTLYTYVMDKKNFKLLMVKTKVTDVHHPSHLHRVGDKLLGVDEKGIKFEVSL